ncbi:MAG: HAMP domain-containing protein [Treponema sp.]|nr:HAMP domain-containing protein [Treponema sp.]
MTGIKPKETAKKIKGIRFPFGIKLALIVTLILLLAIWTITTLLAFMVSTEFVRTAREANFAFNNRAASGVEERVYQIRSEALMLLDMSAGMGENIPQLRQIRNIFFERNPHIAAIILPGVQEIMNQSFFANNQIPLDALTSWLVREYAVIERSRAGEPVLKNVSPFVGINLLALFYPWQNTGLEEAAVIFFSPQSISEITGAGPSTTLVVNGEGDILVHPDFNQVLTGANISGGVLFDTLWKAQSGSVNTSFTEGGERYIGAGRQISIASASVFSTMEYSLINEQISAVTRRNILFSVTVMFLTILATWYFSRTITKPMNDLITAAGRLETGDFNLDLAPKSQDELGVLTERFIHMGQGLRKWVETQNLVGRYNSKEITAKAMSGDLNLQGEYIRSVVLSVNFVSFSDISGTMSAEESLDLLNFFISRLAESVEKNGGIIDKLLGSRIIAVWGVPSSSGDMAREVMNCLRSILSVRSVLWDLNMEREKEGKSFLEMHCGVHMGEVLVGSIGISSYYSYCITGKVVDDAVLIGDRNHVTETDIIISEAVRDLAGNRILAEELAAPKSEEDVMRLFGLVNLTPAKENEKQRWPFTMNDVWESLRAGKSVQINSGANGGEGKNGSVEPSTSA